MIRLHRTILPALLLVSGIAAAEQIKVEVDSLAIDSVAVEDSLGNDLGTAWGMVAVVTVKGSNNEGITSLSEESFSVTIDGTACEVVQAEHSQAGVAIILCLDTSRTMNRIAFEGLKQAVSDCIDSLRTQDYMAIYSFNDEVTQVSDFSNNKAFLKSTVEGLVLGGNRTMLWQAIFTALTLLESNQPEETPGGALVVFSDGMDDPQPGGDPGAYNVDQCVQKANELGVPVMTIGFAQSDVSGLQFLQNISDRTDGQYTPPGASEEFSEQFRGTLRSLRCVYTVVVPPAFYEFAERSVVVEVNEGPLTGASDPLIREFGSEEEIEEDSETDTRILLIVIGGLALIGIIAFTSSRRKSAIRKKRALRDALARSEAQKAGAAVQPAQPIFPNRRMQDPGFNDLSELDPTAIDSATRQRAPAVKQEISRKTVIRAAGAQYSSALLLMIEGPDAGKEYPLDYPEITIGSAEDNVVTIPDPTVSRKHAVIRYAAAMYELEDSNSTNGIFLNDIRIQREMLTDGDVLRLGKCRLVFKGTR